MSDKDVILQEIVIRRILDADGNRIFQTTHSEDFTFVDTLGLLEAAKWELFHLQSQYTRGERGS